MPESIGQQLKTAREKRNLSVQDVVEELHIREHYLVALEEDRGEEVLPAVQAKGFLRLYAEFLGINPFVSEFLDSTLTNDEKTPHIENNKTSDDEPEIDIQQPEDQTQGQSLLGDQFSKARIDKNLTFEAIEEELHIGNNYLQAIENGSFELLPPGIQARGLVQRYAEYLELDSDQILSEYADLLLNKQSAASDENKKKRKKTKKIDGAKQFFTTDVIIGLSLLAVIFVIIFFSIREVISTRNVIATNVPTDEVFIASRTPTLNLETTPTIEDVIGTAVPGEISTATLQVRPTNEAEGNLSSRVILQVIANQRAYLRITADGETAFDGRVVGGNIYEFYGEERIELLTGNAAALDITVIQDGNETRLGRLGLVGQVVNLTFQPDVIITPTVTPSLTPTITNTPQATNTSTPTASQTPED